MKTMLSADTVLMVSVRPTDWLTVSMTLENAVVLPLLVVLT
jgi:hypothetical protein